MQAGRKKPDKLKNMLADAELQHKRKTIEMERLLRTNEALVRKQSAVDQIIAGYTAISCIFAEHGLSHKTGGQVHQQLQFCLDQLGGVSHRHITLQPHAVEYMQTVYNPNSILWAQAMTDRDILQHLRHAMGKCAIMVLQEQGEAAWQQQHPAGSSLSVPSAQPQQDPGRRCGHPIINTGLAAAQQGPFLTPAPAPAHGSSGPAQPGSRGHSSSALDSPHGTANRCSASSSSSYSPVWGRGPAFEISVVWGMLFTWDNSRFMRLISLDLETGRELKVRHGPGFGRWLVDRLCLTQEQKDVFKGLRDLVKQQHEHLPTTIQQASTQQQMLTSQQQRQTWASNIRSAGQVYEAQEQVLQQQAAAVERFRTLAEFMGLVTLNTLTPAQLAVLHACSWPAVCRIEPVLDVLDDV